jgi:hypothetical protein
MTTKTTPSQRATTVIKRERRKTNTDVLETVLGKPKKTGKHKLPQSTFRLDDETKRKLNLMRKELNANQVDVIVFAINQFYSLFEDKSTVDRIQAIIGRKVQRKSQS